MWSSCLAGLFFVRASLGASARDHAADAGQPHVQQMLETIGTRSSRLGQLGPPIARGSMNNTSSPTIPVSRLLLEFERLLDVNFGFQTIKGNAHTASLRLQPQTTCFQKVVLPCAIVTNRDTT